MSDTTLTGANLHRIKEEKTRWQGANRELARGTDTQLAAAEDFGVIA
jgi:hypothetical protein